MRTSIWLSPLALIFVLATISISPRSTRAAEDSPVHVEFQMAVYLLEGPKRSLEVQVKALQAKAFADLTTLGEAGTPVTKPGIRVRAVPAEDYAPPNEQSLKYFGRGLDAAQVAKLGKCDTAWIVDFAAPPVHAVATVRRAAEFMHRLAVDNGSVVWDELTREVFSPDAWKARRIDGWTDGVPHVKNHIAIHYYIPEEGSLPRAITLGMSKFGRPDVVVEQAPRDNNKAIGSLINATCQTLVEGPPVPAKVTTIDLDVHAMKHPAMAELIKSFLDDATGKAKITIRDAKHQEGDPVNRILELRFDTYEGGDALERQAAAIAKAFGSSDKVTPFKDDDPEIIEARKRAKVAIAQKKIDFRKGLPVGDHLLVKAPFKTSDDSKEWMWVEVVRWDGDQIRGILQNDPFKVPGLKAGASVSVSEADLYDFILYHADGTSEGNETGKIMAKREKESQQ